MQQAAKMLIFRHFCKFVVIIRRITFRFFPSVLKLSNTSLDFVILMLFRKKYFIKFKKFNVMVYIWYFHSVP